MVLLTSSKPSSYRSSSGSRTPSYDTSRRHVTTGKFQRITGHESYSPPPASVSAGYRSGVTPGGVDAGYRSSVTPGQAAAARSAAYAASSTDDFLESEQYFRKMYPRYFSNSSSARQHLDTSARSTSVDRTPSSYVSGYRSHRASSVSRVPSGDSRAHRGSSVDNRAYRASSVTSFDGRQHASSVLRAPSTERMTRASSVCRISSVQGTPRTTRASSVSRITSAKSLAPPIDSLKSRPFRSDGDDLVRKARQIRASSLSRFNPENDDDDEDESYLRPTARMSRASSVSRLNDYTSDSPSKVIYVPRDSSTSNRTLNYTSTVPTPRAASVSRFSDHEYETLAAPIKTYGGTTAEYVIPSSSHISSDIASYVLSPGQAFEPNDIEVSLLPSGQRAVTYTQTSQTAGAGNDANRAIERIIERTQHMHTVADSLENFVRRWRHLFPADTLVIQYISYFRLKPEQLRAAGEREDAEVYGMRLRERLIVPHGTDVRSLLRDFNSSQVDIEYRTVHDIRAAATEGLDAECERSRHDNTQRSRFVYRPRSRAPSVSDDYKVIGYPTHRARHTSVESVPRYERHTSVTSPPPPVGRRCASVDSSGVRRSVSPVRTKRRESYNYQPPRARRTSVESFDMDTHHRTRPRQSPAPSSRPPKKQQQRDATPQFTSSLCPKRCRQGQSVRLSCIVDSLDKVHVTWFKGQQEISDGGRNTISNKRGVLSLEITDVVPEDAGIYSVKASNADGEAVCNASLEVKESSPPAEVDDGTEKPKFILELTNQCVSLGAKLILKVKASGKPKPSFKWQLDNRTIVDDSRTKLTSDERGNARLQISDVQQADLGLYICTATNRIGNARCSTNVRTYDEAAGSEPLVNGGTRDLYDELARETVPAKSFNFTEAASGDKPQGTKPWFLQPIPTEISVHQGEPLTLQCVVDGLPKPVVSWYKGVRELQYGRRHRIVVENDHHMLQAVTTLQTDSGQYVVEAVNRVGKVRATCWVNLLPPRDLDDDDDSSMKRGRMTLPEFEHSARTPTEKTAMAPHFVKLLPFEKEVVEGATLEMECRVGDGDISDVINDDQKVVQNGEGPLENGLDAAEPDAQGSVEVTEVQESAEVTDVQSEPVEAEITLETSEQPVQFEVQESAEVTEAQNEPIEAEITLETSEQPVQSVPPSPQNRGEQAEEQTIIESEMIENNAESFTVQTSAEVNELTAEDITSTLDAASEDVEFSIDITSEEKVGENEKPEIIVNGDISRNVEEVVSEVVEVQLEATPENIKTEQRNEDETVVEKVEDISSQRETHEDTAPEDAKSNEAVQSAEVTTSVESAEVTNVESVEVEVKVEEVTTNDTVAAKEFLISDMSSENQEAVAVVTSSSSDGVAPSFTVALDSQRIVSGDVARLIVTVAGKPEPQIKWQKDEVDLVEGGRTDIFTDADSFHLEITHVTADDSGVYSCQATNDLGIASCSCLLVVDEPAPNAAESGKTPEFKEPICDCVVDEGADAQFDCRVTGDPTPEVTWSKGARTLTTSKKIATSFEGGVHLLVISDIHKSDEGEYECRAENSVGQVTCTASLSIKVNKKTEDSSSESSSDSDSSDSDSSSEDSDSSEDSSSNA